MSSSPSSEFSVAETAPISDGKLEESYGRAFHNLVELGRVYANSCGEIVPGLTFEGLPGLRSSPQGMSSLLLINSRMYSYWQSAPSGPGVYELLAKQYRAVQKDMIKGCSVPECGRKPSDGGPKLQACSACGVPFYCSKECQRADWSSHKKNCKVWRQGNNASNRDVRVENLPAEVKVMRQALNWDLQFWGCEEHRITGAFFLVQHTEKGMLLLKAGDENKPPAVYVAQGIADSLMDVIKRSGRSLPVKANLTLLPFLGRLVYDGLIQGSDSSAMPTKGDLEGRVHEAQVRGDVIESMQLPDTPPERKAFRMSKEGAGASGETSSTLSAAARKALKDIEAARKDNNEQTQFWVCRRWGYTKAENPHNMAVFMAGPVPVPSEPMRSRRLEYTGEELVLGLAKGVKAMKKAPRMLGIDCMPALEEVKEDLARVGITAGYYPPPSAEERRMFGS